MSIRNKLFIGFGLVLLVSLIALSIVTFSLRESGKSFQSFNDSEVEKLRLVQQIQYEDITLTNAIRGIIISPDSKEEKDIYDKYGISIEKSFQEIKPLIHSAKGKELFKELDKYNVKLLDLEAQMIKLAATDSDKTLAIFNGEYAAARDSYSNNLEEFKALQLEILDAKAKQNVSKINRNIVISLIGSVASIIIGIFLALYIARIITRPLNQVVGKLNELSGSEGDLTARLEIKSKDEIGQLSLAFNKTIETIQTIIKQVKVTSAEVGSSAEELSASTEQNSHATNQVTTSIQQIAAGTENQVKVSAESATAMQEMAIGIQRIAESSAQVTESSVQTTEVAQKGMDAVEKSIQQMNVIQESVSEGETKVKELNELSIEIGQIVEVITGIADQTNLLALNAAIEAARAGESGKGFAVVADEVRKLAEESKTSASKITDLILSIQSNTAHAVTYMSKGSSEVEQGITVVSQASRAFDDILRAVQTVSEQIQEVSAASQQMSAGTEEVAASIEGLTDIAKQASAQSQDVAASSEEQLASIEEVAASTETLSKLAEKLQLLVGKFKV
jgi:methyl-accepting chemotaxis protein